MPGARSRALNLTSLLCLGLSLASLGGVPAARVCPGANQRPEAREAPHARLSLICDTDAPRPGDVIRLGVRLMLDKGWHVYWNGLNDAGGPPKITLTLPPGYTADAALWPAPERHVSPGDILDHVYDHELTVLVPVHVPRDAAPTGEARFAVKCEWMICATICKLEEGEAGLTLPLGAPRGDEQNRADADRKSIAEAVKRLPRPLAEAKDKVRVVRKDSGVEMRAEGATRLVFYPSCECVWFADLLHEGEAKGDRLSMRFEEGKSGPVSGILGVFGPDGKSCSWYSVDLPEEKRK